MDYIKSNKEAWEEAFEHRKSGWCDNISARLQNEEFPFLEKEFVGVLRKFDIKNKTVGQFCCNNGRELLSVVRSGAKRGVGFDIAENMIGWANEAAHKSGINCKFIATNILDIGAEYDDSFDFIFITVGALTWFEDLTLLFGKVSRCLKKGGILMIHETHPVANMLGIAGEENYDENCPHKLVNSYFRQEPWTENGGMAYMCERPYESKTFYSHTHTLSAIINALSAHCLTVSRLHEFQKDISGSFVDLSGKGIPLSYILVAQTSC